MQLLNDYVHTRRWVPVSGSSTRERGVYLLHGTGEHCGRYDEFATQLTAAGWSVGAHDHPGHGESQGQPGSLLPVGVLAVQAAIQIQRFAAETGAPPIVFGHSLGGLLATELVLCHHLTVAGLVLSAPAFRPWISTPNRIKLKIFNALMPDKVLKLTPHPELLTRDEEKLSASRNDNLIHSFRSARMVNWFFDAGAKSIELAPSLSVPTLVLIAGADPVIDPASIREWTDRAPASLVSSHEYPGAYHEILNEIPLVRDQVIRDTLAWLDPMG